MTESEIAKKRMVDLSRMSYERGIYTYSDFLTLAQQSDLDDVARSGALYGDGFDVFGGCQGAERVMVRFGNLESLGYDEPWPIACIRVEPLNQKFAENLSHRDVLGSLMNLGIERSLLGDIIIRNDESERKGRKCIYVFVMEHIADTLCHELTRIRHTSVNAVVVENVDETIAPTLLEANMQVKSERIDLVISHVYNLSRSQAAELFLSKKVFINGRLMENESHTLKSEDVVSVRGIGRFIYKGITGTTKKGNLNIQIFKYV